MKVESINLLPISSVTGNYCLIKSKEQKQIEKNPITQITFMGQDKNPNQIAVIATECVPYSASGGLAAVTRDMTKAYKEGYPNKDIRLFLPFYNSDKSGAVKNSNGELVYVVAGVKDNNNENLQFKVEDTGINTDFKYGIKNSHAKLYKIKNPESGVPTYMVHIPELADINKQYSSDDFSLFEKYCAFSFATANLLKKMNNDTEDFNPKILHTKDWHTVLTNYASNDSDLKKIHELLNANSKFHGKIPPLAAALNIFNEEQINRMVSDKNFKKELYQLTLNNKAELLKGTGICDLDKEINNPDSAKKILKNISQDYPRIMFAKNNYFSNIAINNAVRAVFPDINWDENADFNPTVNAINDVDGWFTISKTHFNELLTRPELSSLSLYNMLRLNLDKGDAVLNKIDISRYDPANPNQVEYTYNINTFEKGKTANKNFIFDNFSQVRTSRRNFSKKLINNPENARVYGYLDKRYISNPLTVNISRFDTNQKGSDIALKAIAEVMKRDKNMNFVLGLPDIGKLAPDMLEQFVKDYVLNPEYRGRIVLIDGYLPINEYLAGADFSIIPSRSETCGLVGYQSMRMGAIPISTPVGSMNDCLITPEQDINKAMGFKTPVHFFHSKHPERILANTIEKAKIMYEDEPEQIKRMVKNSMAYNSDWSTAIKEQNALYEKVASGEKVNNLTLNDIRPVEDRVDLKMLNEDDIYELPQADVLVVLAHSDDEIFFLPMMKYLDEGKSVQVVYACSNEKGHYKKGAPSTPKELAKHREIEALESLSAMGVKSDPIKLNIPDLELSDIHHSNTFKDYLNDIIEQVDPKIVLSFAPDGYTDNPDHKKTGEIAYKCVRQARINDEKDIKLYQMTLSEENADKLREIMSTAQTDAFDFVRGTKEENIRQTVNIDKFSDGIRKSLEKQQSQWSDSEVEGLMKYYLENGAQIAELKYFQIPEVLRNPWIDRAQHFSNMYGKEFTTNGKEVMFRPEGSNVAVNLYLTDNDSNKRVLWLENSVFDYANLDISGDTPQIILGDLIKVRNIPKFSQVETVKIANKNRYGERYALSISLDELKEFAPYIKDYCKEPLVTLERYKKACPLSTAEREYVG